MLSVILSFLNTKYLLFFVLFAMLAYTVFRGLRNRNIRTGASKLRTNAVVVSKRMDYSENRNMTFNGRTQVICYVTFCLSGGEQLELGVDSRTYETLTEGDQGSLMFKGNSFLGFDRA